MSSHSPYRLHASLGYHLSLAARIQERRLEEGLKTLGLTRITWCVLLAIGNEGLSKPSDIARFVGIDRTATSRALRQMENEKMIARHSGSTDGRTREVVLSDLGQSLLDKGTPMAVDNNAVMLNRLGAEETARMIEKLQSLLEGEDMSLAQF